MQFNCDCQTVKGVDKSWNNILNQFENLRKNCAALKEIFVPESEWSKFREMAPNSFAESGHRSILLGALKHGRLGRLTLPIHCFLLDGGKPKESLIKSYRKSLVEKWMLQKTSLRRHKEVRRFNGKLAELISSSWLESQG
jgi:hypothetical protein